MADSSLNTLLASLGEFNQQNASDVVIYGVSDRSKESFWVRWNDFWIDHQSVPMKEKSYFFHLLSVMLDSGIPLLKSLQILSQKTSHERFCRIIATMAHYVEDGRHLSEAMAKFPTVFDESELGVVRSGEAIGRLDMMLERLSDQLDRAYTIHLKLRSAFMYPVVVMVILVLATLIVMTWVIPRLEVFFTQSGVTLPWVTRIVLGLSEFTVSYWWLLIVLGLVGFFTFSLYVNTDEGRLKLDYWKLKLPFTGELMSKGLLSKFVRLLGILVASGLPINKVLGILQHSMNNTLYEMKIGEVIQHVERGEKISENLATTPFLFPSTVTQMLAIGESSATLDKACEKLSTHYEREIEHTIKNMMTVLEPFIIVLVGVAVGVLALAILGPVFSLSELV